MKKIKCSCGVLTSKIRYTNNKTTCDSCQFNNLSGQWMKRAEGDKNHYAKDILQRFNKDGTRNEDFETAYGDKPYKDNENHDYLKRND